MSYQLLILANVFSSNLLQLWFNAWKSTSRSSIWAFEKCLPCLFLTHGICYIMSFNVFVNSTFYISLCWFWLIFFLNMGLIFLLLCMPANLWLDGRHCEIFLIWCCIFLYVLWSFVLVCSCYLEIVWSFCF